MKKFTEHMKNQREKVHFHAKKVHAHVRKHHKKYLFGIASAAFLIKIVPVLIAWLFTAHVNYSFANDNPELSWLCESWNIEIQSPSENAGITTEEIELTWNLVNNADCNGKTFNVSLYNEDNTDTPLFSDTVSSDSSPYSTGFLWENISAYFRISILSWDDIVGSIDSPVFVINNQPEDSDVMCTSWDIEITSPVSWTTITWTDVKLEWNLSWTACAWQEFTIKMKTWDSDYTYLWTWLAESKKFDTTVSTWMSWTAQFAIYSWWELLVEWPIFTVNVDWDSSENTWWNNSWNTWWNDSWNTWWNITWQANTNICTSWNITITSPLSWQKLKSSDVKLEWTLTWNACSGEDFVIKLFDSWYEVIWVVPANSWNFIYTWISGEYKQVNFAIYYTWEDNELTLLKQWDSFIVDNQSPTITGVTHVFNPTRTNLFWLDDKVYISFTWSEELTWITVNVMGKNAEFSWKNGLTYSYVATISTWNNTWNLEYNISFQDIAWNSWESYHTIDTWKTLDVENPTISGNIVFENKSGYANVSLDISETWKILFTYTISGGANTWTVSWWNTKSFSSRLQKAKNYSWSRIYKYVVTIEDLVWNKNYYGWTFQFSWDTINHTMLNTWDSILSVHTWVSVLGTLRAEVPVFSGCKAEIRRWIDRNSYVIQEKTWTDIYLTIELPNYSDSKLNTSTNNLVTIIKRALSQKNNITQGKIDAFATDFNNYLLVLKMKKDTNPCGNSMSILPGLYMSKFLKSLKNLELIK